MANYPQHSSENTTSNSLEEEILNPVLVEESPFIYDDPGLPPGIASEIPEHVYRFEKAWQDSKTVSIYELLNKPFFLSEKDLDNETLTVELKRITDLMEQNKISLEIPAGTEPKDVYRFITEFLFKQEIDDLKLEGLSRHFIYKDNYALE